MQRKEFLKQGFKLLGLATVAPIIASCQKDSSTSTACGSTTPSETEGPYPTHSPASYAIKDIRSDRTGVQLTAKITIKKASGAVLSGALVDIWHCDKDGNYSEYGSLTSVHFLRGRQTTNTEGVAEFLTIFPGWYPGRAPHIHVHIYDASGNSLLVTQIAFPTDVCDTVYTTSSYYTKGKQDTSNASDNIFSDSLDCEMPTVAGSISGGYTLTHTITVS